MAVVQSRRPAAQSSYSTGWVMLLFDAFRRLWARRNLSPQQRADLLVSYSPVGVLAATPSGHTNHPRGGSGLNGRDVEQRRVS